MKLSKHWRIISLATLTSIYLTMMMTFFMAVMNPNHRVMVTINTYGEMGVEIALLVTTFPVIVMILVENIVTAMKGKH